MDQKIEITDNRISSKGGASPLLVSGAKFVLLAGAKIVFGKGSTLKVGQGMQVKSLDFRGPKC